MLAKKKNRTMCSPVRRKGLLKLPFLSSCTESTVGKSTQPQTKVSFSKTPPSKRSLPPSWQSDTGKTRPASQPHWQERGFLTFPSWVELQIAVNHWCAKTKQKGTDNQGKTWALVQSGEWQWPRLLWDWRRLSLPRLQRLWDPSDAYWERGGYNNSRQIKLR